MLKRITLCTLCVMHEMRLAATLLFHSTHASVSVSHASNRTSHIVAREKNASTRKRRRIILCAVYTRKGLCRERLDARRKARQFARYRFFLDDAFGHRALQFRLRALERLARRALVARSNRFFDFAKEGSDARTARFIHFGAARNLAHHLLG